MSIFPKEEMAKIAVVIPPGSLLTVSTGCYSNYIVHGVFRALKPVDADALRSVWLTAHPDEAEAYSFDEYAFLAWVAAEGYLEALPSFEWHLADYSRASEMTIDEPMEKL